MTEVILQCSSRFPVSEIFRPDYEGYAENVIEWVEDSKRAALSLSQRRTISRVRIG